MEIVQELVFTALIALLFSYLVAKIVSFGMAAGGDDSGSASGSIVKELKDVDDEVIIEELQFGDRMNVGILESQNRVKFVEETTEKVDRFHEELHQVVETELVGLHSSEEMVVEKDADTDDGFVREKTAVESDMSKDAIVLQSEEINVVGKESKADLVSDDDCEGIERSELENIFRAAVKFAEKPSNKGDLLSDMQMELFALHKVATEGPCYEPQPMPLMLSASSKWLLCVSDGRQCLRCARNAWQKLGKMNPEETMEQYVALLSDRVLGWMKETYGVVEKLESEDIGKPDVVAPPDMGSFKGDQTDRTHERWFAEMD